MGNPNGAKGSTIPVARLWERVDIQGEDECWEWTGYRMPTGYGQIGSSRRVFLTHRMAYELAVGPVPADIHVRHKCDNPPCCNPAHLELGTARDNSDDKWSRGRGLTGERHGNVKLTSAQVIDIRSRAAAGESAASMAREYGVCQPHVSGIIRGDERKAG